ncbi:MAG: DNA-directed RNA polymerase subunit H [Nitrososphaerota archaeon]|nr:DNA-directed RNA polymerase subunit H [Candidatus Geocrenenecus dongiae]
MSKKVKREKVQKKEEKPKFSILEHELVPEHRILSPEEAEQVLKKYGVRPQQLPYILVSDPVVKEIGAKPGDIIEIKRKSPTAGEAVYYRVVVTGE